MLGDGLEVLVCEITIELVDGIAIERLEPSHRSHHMVAIPRTRGVRVTIEVDLTELRQLTDAREHVGQITEHVAVEAERVQLGEAAGEPGE